MFGEAMEMVRLLESQERTTFEGKHYSLENAPFEPKPVNDHMPILVGSTGKRMMRHVARYADIWDGGGTPEQFVSRGARLDELCRDIGRNPSEIRWAYQHAPAGLSSIDAFSDHVRAYAGIGVSTFLIDVPRGSPSPVLREIANSVIPDLRASHSSDVGCG
jgi:hypothetical protein